MLDDHKMYYFICQMKVQSKLQQQQQLIEMVSYLIIVLFCEM